MVKLQDIYACLQLELELPYMVATRHIEGNKVHDNTYAIEGCPSSPLQGSAMTYNINNSLFISCK